MSELMKEFETRLKECLKDQEVDFAERSGVNGVSPLNAQAALTEDYKELILDWEPIVE